jgi:hypothetical protein
MFLEIIEIDSTFIAFFYSYNYVYVFATVFNLMLLNYSEKAKNKFLTLIIYK